MILILKKYKIHPIFATFMIADPLIIATDFVFNNQFATIIVNGVVTCVVAYFVNKFKK